MRQLVLDIRPETPRSFDNFVPGDNAEALARLAAAALPGAVELVYLYGAPGSGRSHLLAATARAAQAQGRPVARLTAALREAPPAPGTLLLADDVDACEEAAQIALFNAFNAARRDTLALVIAGPAAPAQLALREDLRTRLGAALVFEVKPLSEADLARTLTEQAHARGMALGAELIEYLLRHGRRDLPSLLAVLDALDQASLEQQRPLTLPLLRSVMQRELL